MEILPPFIQHSRVFAHNHLDRSEFSCSEANVARKSNWVNPKLAAALIAVDVNMWWLVGFVTIKI